MNSPPVPIPPNGGMLKLCPIAGLEPSGGMDGIPDRLVAMDMPIGGIDGIAGCTVSDGAPIADG